MLEPVSALQPLAEAFLQPARLFPPLPPPASDVARFEAALNGAAAPGDSLIVEPAQRTGSLGDQIWRNVVEIDKTYRALVERVSDWPSLEPYLDKHPPAATGAPLIPEAGGSTDPERFATQLEGLKQQSDAFYAAGIEYARDSTRWFLQTEFWLTKMRLLAAAVSQTSQGLTTLLRST